MATYEDNAGNVALEKAPASVAADSEAVVCRPRGMRFLHWFTAVCVVVVAALALVRDEVAGRVARQWLLEGHRHVGLLVLALVVVRVIVRWRLGRLPEVVHSRLIRVAAWCTHAALYAVLFAMPLIGWALSNAEGKPVHLFGLTLPALVADDEDLADQLLTWHQDVAWALLALVALHVSAALWHHFVRRDGVLRSMWPARRG
jgi:cytochrome b561